MVFYLILRIQQNWPKRQLIIKQANHRRAQQQIIMNSILTGQNIICRQTYYMAFYQKEIILKTEEEGNIAVDFSSVIGIVHEIGFIAASALYFLSTFFSLPYFTQENSHFLIARQLLFNFSIVLAISQSCQIATKLKMITKFEVITFMVSIGGCIVLALTSLCQQTYNQGTKYMVSSFLLSVSNQLKIIKLLVPKNRLQEQRSRFLVQLSCCCSSILFFFGAVIKETGLQAVYVAQICPTVNFLSGVLMSLSVYYMYRSKQDKGSEGYQGIANVNQVQ